MSTCMRERHDTHTGGRTCIAASVQPPSTSARMLHRCPELIDEPFYNSQAAYRWPSLVFIRGGSAYHGHRSLTLVGQLAPMARLFLIRLASSTFLLGSPITSSLNGARR